MQLFILFILLIFLFIFFSIFVALITKTLWNGAYFAETSNDRLQDILKLAKLKSTDNVIDLGSGDGRVVLAIAERGTEITGIEINPFLVLVSQIKLLFASSKVKRHANIIQGNLWHHSLTPYNVVIFYGVPSMLPELKRKLKKELKPGTKVVSVLFSIPGWKAKEHKGDIWLY